MSAKFLKSGFRKSCSGQFKMSLFHLEKASVQPFHLLSPMVTNFETALKQLFGKQERYSAYGIYSIDFSFRFLLVKVVCIVVFDHC